MTINIGLPTNWMTTLSGLIGGIGIALVGAVSTHLITATNTEMIVFVAMAALGTASTGLVAKDGNTHSTTAQMQKATDQVSEGKLPKS